MHAVQPLALRDREVLFEAGNLVENLAAILRRRRYPEEGRDYEGQPEQRQHKRLPPACVQRLNQDWSTGHECYGARAEHAEHEEAFPGR